MPARAHDPVGEPIGVVLAGGAGRRFGGGKPGALLAGRPLASWVAAALGSVVGEVAIVARADTALPPVGPPVWRESASAGRPHPLAGLAFALQRGAGRDVLACPADLPFVSGEALSALLGARGADGGGFGGAVAVAEGQPLLGRFGASCAPALAAAAAAGASVRATIASLSPTVVAVPDAARVLFNVNTPQDLARARAAVAAGGRPPAR